MEKELPDRAYYSATISGPVSGQVAVGKNIRQSYRAAPTEPPTAAEMVELRQALEVLREQVAAAVPAEQWQAALARVDELTEAVTAGGPPDLPVMEVVRDWFARHLPGMAGAVTGIILNPIVTKLASAAGDVVLAEFKRRFGIG